MLLDLMRMGTVIQGTTYEGAILTQVTWENKSGDTHNQAAILQKTSRFLQLKTADASGTLIFDMLLGHSAPRKRENAPQIAQLTAEIQSASTLPHDLTLCFSAQDILDFTQIVHDTNSLHQGTKPLVPGMLLFQHAWQAAQDGQMQSLRLRFTMPVFAEQEVIITYRKL